MIDGPGQPLAGMRVVDLSRLLPGPLATLQLADLGAEVIKVESPGAGDGSRAYQPFIGGMGVIFASLHRGKRSLALELRAAAGQEVLARLLAGADVLVESFRPGVLSAAGFSRERLAQDYPRLTVCALTGYGQHGPDAGQAGHDLDFIARSGLLHCTGSVEGGPVLPGFQAADVAGALFAVASILAALLGRERGGGGAWLDVSLAEAALFHHLPWISALAAGARSPEPGRGPLAGGLPCYQVYRTADGRHLALAALEPKFWDRFCRASGLEGWPSALLGGDAARRLEAELRTLFADRTLAEWQALLAGADCCAVPVRRPDEVTDDPQFLARDLFFEQELPGGERLRHLASPLTPRLSRHFLPPPRLGEHSVEILAELGYTAAEVEALQHDGVLGEAQGGGGSPGDPAASTGWG